MGGLLHAHDTNVWTVLLIGLNLDAPCLDNGFGHRTQFALLVPRKLADALKVQIFGNEE